MNFDFTAEQKQFAEQVRRFAREHLAKDALKRAHAPRLSVRRRRADGASRA